MVSWILQLSIVEKTFNIMGLTKYSSVFASESEALEGMS